MDLTSILTTNGDLTKLRESLILVKGVLQTAAHDYAGACLSAANEALKTVQAAQPSAAVWPHIVDYNKYTDRTQHAVQAVSTATSLLLTAEETGDDQIDEINADTKMSSIEMHVIAALLEGANNRMQLVLKCLPKNNAPGSLCNPEALLTKTRQGPKKDEK